VQGEAKSTEVAVRPITQRRKAPSTPLVALLPTHALLFVSRTLRLSVFLTFPTSILSEPLPIDYSTTGDSSGELRSFTRVLFIKTISRLVFTTSLFNSTISGRMTTLDTGMESLHLDGQLAHGWQDLQATSPICGGARIFGDATNHR